MKRWARAAAYGAALSVLPALPAGAQDLMAGEKMYQSVCRNCHGPKAQGLASFPKLAGQDAETLTILLQEYRAGEKLGPNTALMAPHAKKLTDEDIANLTAYIAETFE